jgi:hypothetical protein
LFFTGFKNEVDGGLACDDWELNPEMMRLDAQPKRAKASAPICPQVARVNRVLDMICPSKDQTSGAKITGITDEEKELCAHLSRPLSRRGRDKLLYLACQSMLHTTRDLIGAWTPIEKSRVNDIFSEAHKHVAATGADRNHVQLSGGLNTSLDMATLHDYAGKIAKLIRMIIELKVYNFQLIEAALHDVKDVPGGLVTETKEFRILAAAVSKTFYVISVNPHLIFPHLARYLLFEEIGEHDETSFRED